MNYSTFIPNANLQHVIECYWSVDGNDTEQQKIIPDGFPEIIFHFGDRYELIDENGVASLQEKMLVSGQISRPILLRATGSSNVFGIKFKPAGIWRLLGFDMSKIKDRVIPLADVYNPALQWYNVLARSIKEQRVKIAGELLLAELKSSNGDDVSLIIKTIEERKGNVSIEEICERHRLSPRKLQRMFQQQVGITAKQYSRIVRFRTVYALLQKPSLTKTDSLYLSGYFDQPHFNREFREFTNENPEKWFADNNAFSNLFMNR
jgi:AraC-like DNA-binding protein